MESLSAVRLPADTWHAHTTHASRTLCGLPLAELHTFALAFLPVRTDDVCQSCVDAIDRI